MIVFLSIDETAAGELLFLALASIIGILGGWGPLNRRAWAGILVLILAFPVGTALAVYTVLALLKACVTAPRLEL